jgi:hypothetical protein
VAAPVASFCARTLHQHLEFVGGTIVEDQIGPITTVIFLV